MACFDVASVRRDPPLTPCLPFLPKRPQKRNNNNEYNKWMNQETYTLSRLFAGGEVFHHPYRVTRSVTSLLTGDVFVGPRLRPSLLRTTCRLGNWVVTAASRKSISLHGNPWAPPPLISSSFASPPCFFFSPICLSSIAPVREFDFASLVFR